MVSDSAFGPPGSSALDTVTDSVAGTKSLISGHNTKVESRTLPCSLLLTKRLPLCNLMWLLGVLDKITFLRSLSTIDSTFLSAGDRFAYRNMRQL